MSASSHYDVLIIGAGGAGLFCAIEAGRRGRRVLLVDHARKPAEKIRISGGGRCNFTNLHCTPKNFLSQNPHFCISALKSFTQHDFIERVKAHGIAFHEKTLGQLFCDGSSQEIITMLLDDMKAAGAELRLSSPVTEIEKTEAGFSAKVDGTPVTSTSLVIASGGKSIPKMGASGFGYEVAKKFGLKLVDPRPALVPFTFGPEKLEKLQGLSGVATQTVASCNKTSFREALLFTHRGLSGPAVLQISSYWREGDEIALDLLPDTDLLEALKEARQAQPKQEVHTVLARHVPKRLADRLCGLHGFEGRLADLSNTRLAEIADALKDWRLTPDGTEGYRTAEVTLGGVDTDGLSSKTMEARNVPGLYFIGEVVDVTGHLGGFNFQWAWSSGYAAGQHV
ncbi:NAD(P)/FAD-dependent oxidoreductase [Tepidicaulis sp. LMO-SS28]|uniref:NAD(P)/FAD-dependent oxidoreductase n=1 Tax=Tepidicaulis sp. LMO-SS28 TaxID=3447455 RepID=UPI003EE3BEB0